MSTNGPSLATERTMASKSIVGGGHGKLSKQSVVTSSAHSGSPPPLPLSPHPQRRHFVPIERTKGANISDARLVSWRKSLTKLSAQEALENEAAVDRTAVGDDYGEFSYSCNSSSMASMAQSSPQPVASTSSLNASSSSTTPNYRTIVRSRRSKWRAKANGSQAASATLLGSDLDDDQGFHDEEEDVEEEIEPIEEEESVSFDDEACLNGGQKSNCHYFYHRGPNGRSAIEPSSQKIKYTPFAAAGVGSGLKGPINGPPNQSAYYYYRAPLAVPSPLYNDPYGSYQCSPSGLASRLAAPLPSPPRPVSKLQSFFNFSRPSSSGPSGGSALSPAIPPKSAFSGNQTNLNTTLRSSSFFFLASNNYKKTVDEPIKAAEKTKVTSKSHSTSSSTNTCTTSSSSSSSSMSSHQSIFRIMSNSVTELRNRKSLLKKFTLSSSSSSRSSSRRSSVNEKSKLKAKKLKEMYYYDEDDYEEIDEGQRGSKCFLRCCFPFRRR